MVKIDIDIDIVFDILGFTLLWLVLRILYPQVVAVLPDNVVFALDMLAGIFIAVLTEYMAFPLARFAVPFVAPFIHLGMWLMSEGRKIRSLLAGLSARMNTTKTVSSARRGGRSSRRSSRRSR